MTKKLISVTDITSYLFCPRKVYFKLVKGIKEPPNQKMILGFLKHKIFDIFNKNESIIVSSISGDDKKLIKNTYLEALTRIVQEVSSIYYSMMNSFSIQFQDLLKPVLKSMNAEIELRAASIAEALRKGFRGKELWRELKPKYLTEFEIISEELGLKGRIDRVKLEQEIIPYEIKTREKVYQSDIIQLAAYSLLLEKEFNKPVTKGVIETSEKQETIEISQEMKNQVLEIAEEIRNLSEENLQSNFSSNFVKCENCSFKEDCFE